MRFFKNFILIFFFAFSSVFCADCCLASNMDICVVDINIIFQKSHAEKNAKLELEFKQKEMEKILNKVARELSSLSDKCEKDLDVVNEKFLEKKKRELRIRINDFKALKVRFQEELDVLQKKLISEIENEIVDIISNIGIRKDCKVIISSTSVLYFDKNIDITDEVLKKYNENYLKSSKK